MDGLTFGDLEVTVSNDDRLLFPTTLRAVNKDGSVTETPIRCWIPNQNDDLVARIDAIAWMREVQLDRDKEADLFKQLEIHCRLARAVRTFESPHGQLMDAKELAAKGDACAQELVERIEHFKTMVDPRVQEMDEQEFWDLVLKVGKTASIYPLAGIAGRAQLNFLVRMAREASRSPTAKRFVQSSASSTRAR